MTDAVEFDDVTRSYKKGVRGVSRMTLGVPPGVTLGMVGRNGAGKSTAIRLAMGLLRPDEGRVRVLGRDPFEDADTVRRDIGFMAEDHPLPRILSAADVLGVCRDLYPTWDRAFEEDLVGRLGFPLGRKLAMLSTGQRRQVALVGAVAHRPKILLLDEPGGGLDPVVRREFLELVVDLVAERGTTVIYASHVLPEVERISDRIAIVHQGRILVMKDTAALREESCRLLVAGNGSPSPKPQSIPGCVRTTKRDGATSLTFLLPEKEARAAAKERGYEVLQSSSVSFEDLFVDLVGREG